MFPGVGFIWGFCFSCISLVLCAEIVSMSLFFTLPNSWMMVDYFSISMELLVSIVLILSLVCSVKDFSMSVSLAFKGMDSALMLVSIFCVFFFLTGSWLSFYFFFECTLIPTLWMLVKWGSQPERLQAGLFMTLYTAGASLPLFLTLVYMYGVCHTDAFILAKMSCSSLLNVPKWIWGFSLLGFLVKVPIYGFHVWLPKAHVEAPLAGSMVLAGVLLKLGGFGLIRIMWALGMSPNGLFFWLISLGLWGGLVSSFVAVVQCDIKAIIAYSSIGHMSMVVASLLSCYPLGKYSGECMMFMHGLCSPCMFALVGSSYDWTQSRSIALNKGVLQAFPMFSMFWYIFTMLNMGCPPSLNFYSEILMFITVKSVSIGYIVPMGLIFQVSCVYSVFLYGYINHGSVSLLLRSKSGLSDRYLSSFLFSSVVLFLGFFMMDFFF